MIKVVLSVLGISFLLSCRAQSTDEDDVSCLAGQYLLNGVCSDCTVECAGLCSPFSQADCEPCSAGRRIDPEKFVCDDCPGGQFGFGTECLDCSTVASSWSMNVSKLAVCIDCLAPYVYNSNLDDCDECPPGKYYENGECVDCHTSCSAQCTGLNVTSPCVSCPEGQGFFTDANCGSCPPGTFVVSSMCKKCEVSCSAQCDEQGRTDPCVVCPDGSGYDDTNLDCVLCPIGTFSWRGLCFPCSNDCGSTQCLTSGRSKDCCLSGFYFEVEEGKCLPCPKGTYGVDGICLDCNIVCDDQCNSDDQLGRTQDCIVCPAGSGWAGSVCEGCAVGYYSLGNFCEPCLEDCSSQICTGLNFTQNCMVCGVGSFWNQSQSVCQRCNSECELQCSDEVRVTDCTVCDVGFFWWEDSCLECAEICDDHMCLKPGQTMNCHFPQVNSSDEWRRSSGEEFSNVSVMITLASTALLSSEQTDGIGYSLCVVGGAPSNCFDSVSVSISPQDTSASLLTNLEMTEGASSDFANYDTLVTYWYNFAFVFDENSGILQTISTDLAINTTALSEDDLQLLLDNMYGNVTWLLSDPSFEILPDDDDTYVLTVHLILSETSAPPSLTLLWILLSSYLLICIILNFVVIGVFRHFEDLFRVGVLGSDTYSFLFDHDDLTAFAFSLLGPFASLTLLIFIKLDYQKQEFPFRNHSPYLDGWGKVRRPSMST